jgi:NADH-quinone oxidoreductase subunit A
MFVFVAILALGLAYAWVKGHLDWIKPTPIIPDFEGKVPNHLYDNINKKYGRNPRN